MSDQDKTPGTPEVPAGWSQPKTVGGWRELEREPEQDENGGWQAVPAMPENLTVEPATEGEWHLPRPEDTPFTPESEIQVSTARVEQAAVAPEDMELPGSTPSRTPAQVGPAIYVEPELEDDEDDLEKGTGLSDIITLLSMVEPAPTPSLVLDDAPAAESLTEEEDDFSFSGPAVEREALTQASGIQSPLPEPTRTTQPAATEASDYAAEQLRRLMGEEGAATAQPSAAAGDVDAAEYARRQLEQLGGTGGVSEFTPIEQPTPIEPYAPVVDALTQKFFDTEAQVRELRQQYRNNQITREDLQNRLRQLLILDDNEVWWMMGVDTDTWYRYDPAVNNWVAGTPPITAQPPRTGVRTETSPFDPSRLDARLPLIDEREQTQYTGGYTQPGDEFVPQPVPIYDPEATIVGTEGIGLPTVRGSEAETTVGTQGYYQGETIAGSGIGPTVPNQAMQGDYTAVDYAPADEPPVFDGQEAISTDLYEQAVERQRQSLWRRGLLVASLIIGGVLILGAIIVIYIITSYNNIASQYTQQILALENYEPEFQTARIFDAEGNVLASLRSATGGARESVPLSEISPYMIFAVVAQENQRYFEDPGYDPLAIARAFLTNLGAGEVVEGASTITQQIATSLILQDNTPTADNKLREIVIASEIAQRYDKNFILELYLNEFFFGNQTYGVQAAADFYFDKEAKDLNQAESAFLAGLLPSPASYDPVTRREEAFAQMDNTLRRMGTVECLNFQHAPYNNEPFCIPRESFLDANGNFRGDILVQRALVEEREYLPQQLTVEYPHFVNYVQAVLERQFGPDEIFRRGFQVHTTLNTTVQEEAERALRDQLRVISGLNVNTGSVMVVDPRDGAIRAMVGSPDFANDEIGGQINFALTWQQPGSTIKPVVYLGALEGVGDANVNGVLDFNEYLTAGSILWDVPTTYSNPTYQPVNFDGRFRGPVSVRYALANSLNVPAVKAYQFIGNDKFVDTARRLGLTFLTDPPQVGLPTGLGATEVRLYDMMQAYATLANTGRYVPMYAIVRVTDIDGNEIALEARPEPVQRFQAEHTFLIQNILSDNTARADTFGTTSQLLISGLPADRVAAKTGTSNDARDLWTMGFTRNMVVGIWMGRADNGPTRGSSIDHTAPVWNQTMRTALRTVPVPDPFTPTGNIVQQVICNLTGTLPSDNCTNRRNELFVANQQPAPATQGVVITIPVDTWTGFRANQSCPENVENRTFVNIGDPFAVQWLAGPGQAIAQQLGLPNPPQSPPAQACDVNTVLPTARITSPTSGQVLQNIVQIQGVAAAQNFDRYQLMIAPQQPNGTLGSFQLLATATTTQMPNQGTLGQWDTRTVQNGVYILRLEMFATAASGGGYLRRDVQVTVQNILPTATPTLIPTIPLPTPSTIPFPTTDNSFIQPTVVAPFGAATATATINVGG